MLIHAAKTQTENSETHQNSPVLYWLSMCIIMVLVMVLIGGLTRLTHSGLSMVEWKPITGILPPLTQQEWMEEFAKYQTSPEFKQINSQMTVDGFKQIFWLEYIHRIAARITGLVFFIPCIFFWMKNRLAPRTKRTILIAAVIGICQGFMGWYMVKSGLSKDPFVSHFRLSFHLIFALSIFLVLLDETIRLFSIFGFAGFKSRSRVKESIDDTADHDSIYLNSLGNYYLPLKLEWMILLAIIICQIFLGGLVAGLKAGLVYNQFPYMGEDFWPKELYQIPFSNYLSDPAIVQFIHRIGAYVCSIAIFVFSIKLLNQKMYLLAILLLLTLVIQFLLGVYTLLYHVPISLAEAHQLVAFILAGVVLIIGRTSSKTT